MVARGRCQELAAGFACLGTSISPGHAASQGDPHHGRVLTGTEGRS